MRKISNNELIMIVGGFNITGVIIKELTNAGKFIYSLGQAFGSSLRRIGERNVCPVK